MIAKADAFQSSINRCVDRSEKPSALAVVEVVEGKKGVRLSEHQPGNRLAEEHQKLRGFYIFHNRTIVSSFSGVVQSDLGTAMVKVNLYAAPPVPLFMVILH